MRKSDLELLEMRLEPHSAAIDRLTRDVGQWTRVQADMLDRVKDLERDKEAHSTSIAQGLASVRSILQRANKLTRELEVVEEEEENMPVDPVVAPVNIRQQRDDVIRRARARHPGASLL